MSWVVLIWFDVCWYYVVVWLWWCGIRIQCLSLHTDTTPPQPNHNVTPTHIEPEQYNPTLILLITASQDGWIFPSQSWELRNSMMMIKLFRLSSVRHKGYCHCAVFCSTHIIYITLLWVVTAVNIRESTLLLPAPFKPPQPLSKWTLKLRFPPYRRGCKSKALSSSQAGLAQFYFYTPTPTPTRLYP